MTSPSFADLGVPAAVVRTLSARGLATPFPVQALTLPDALAGRDVSGAAATGSGKTVAFGIPLVVHVDRAEPRRPTGLVLTPTRELAAQVRDELLWLGGHRKLRVAALYGGVGFGAQRAALRRGVDVVVACPGRLTDLVDQGEIRLDGVTHVVVDEADRLADEGFLPAVQRLLDRTPEHRQTLLFSATFDGPVGELARRYQRDPVLHRVAPDAGSEPRLAHSFWKVRDDERIARLGEIAAAAGPTIVFCRTKRRTERIARQLSRAGTPAEAIHGDRSQGQRDRALAAFARGRVGVLVATDVAARGIHVDGVACVVHFDLPAVARDYTHRSGRTGRAGATGIVVAFVAPDQGKDAARLQRELGLTVGVDRAGDLPEHTESPPASPGAAEPAFARVSRAPDRAAESAPGRRRGLRSERGDRSARTARRDGMHPSPTPTGTVKWFHGDKGYGFITRDGAGDDLFVHVSQVADGPLAPGTRVTFEVGPGRKGDEARRVRRADPQRAAVPA